MNSMLRVVLFAAIAGGVASSSARDGGTALAAGPAACRPLRPAPVTTASAVALRAQPVASVQPLPTPAQPAEPVGPVPSPGASSPPALAPAQPHAGAPAADLPTPILSGAQDWGVHRVAPAPWEYMKCVPAAPCRTPCYADNIRCEARMFRSTAPKCCCQAIHKSLHTAVWNAFDLPHGMHECCRKICNTYCTPDPWRIAYPYNECE